MIEGELKKELIKVSKHAYYTDVTIYYDGTINILMTDILNSFPSWRANLEVLRIYSSIIKSLDSRYTITNRYNSLHFTTDKDVSMIHTIFSVPKEWNYDLSIIFKTADMVRETYSMMKFWICDLRFT